MEKKEIILYAIIVIYLIFNFFTLRKILKNKVLTSIQKLINSIMIFIIPFIWYFLISELLDDKVETMTKTKRDKLRKKKRGGFYESGIGING
ncbi:hypothetical protein [Wenyingzhuangia sp. 2_MG-2023]|uniref:hypothetical protein n=1 Tax=Wenyingzhuangia sp. 2_MG-2023 TaxID=3062639 RepID=UPI0026E1F738|nr:hypothetical protein [Wenyingzhuangia sp. 2_MG-2023]MDO6739441.1 hypothetical protein [Wenyingzhuangia sp. 2_MG-2023]